MTSRQDLLDLISTKESELARMRREAAESASEEIRSRDVRLQELRRDFEHNLGILQERERAIASLRQAAAEAEEAHAAEVREVKRISEERVESIQDEARARERQWREEGERTLNAELERRLAERERCLREELAASASSELADRERQISAAYERAAAEREAACKRREGAADNRVRDVERARAEELRDAEARWSTAEAELRDRLSRGEKIRKEAEARLRDGLTEADGLCSQRDEQIARMVRELKGLEHEIARLQEDNARLDGLNAEKDGKVSDLLQTLIDLETAFLHQHGELQADHDELASQLRAKCDEVETVNEKFSRVEAGWRTELSKVAIEMEEKQRQWSLREEELVHQTKLSRIELKELIEEKEKNEDAAQKEIEKAKNTIGDLEAQIEQLRIDSEARLDETNAAKKLLEAERDSTAHLRLEHSEALSRCKEAHAAAELELRTKFHAEVDTAKRASIDNVRHAILEKDAAVKEQQAAMDKVAKLQDENDMMRSRLSGQDKKMSLASSPLQHRPDLSTSMVSDDSPDTRGFPSPHRETSVKVQIESEIDRVRSENSRLKDMVAMMRKEMETLITSSTDSIDNVGIPKPAADSSRSGDLGSVALERQLRQCREYLNLMLGGAGAKKRGERQTSNDEITLLRDNFRELHKIIDDLREENKRLLSRQTALAQTLETAKEPTRTPSDINASGREEELRNRIVELSDELQVVLSDRRRLIDLSNKLRVDLQRAHSSRVDEGMVDDIKGKENLAPITESGRSHICQHCSEGSLLGRPMTVHEGSAEGNVAIKALGRATSSQKQVYARLQRNQQKRSNLESKKPERRKVRNWNHQDDT